MKLWILRHARAEAHSTSGRDFDRALTREGQIACDRLRVRLEDAREPTPVTILVSPAARTQQTAQRALPDWPEAERRVHAPLWEATLSDLLQAITTSQPAQSLMLVGHNPGLELLVQWLGGELPVTGLKPGSLVVLDLPNGPTRDSARTVQFWPAIESR
ncbi:MAG: SixA phosphatase family protein [Wenzhouxiangella sp.]